jgi:hypothetical protein
METNLEIKQVTGRQELRRFIHLPAKIHKGHKNWVPPIYMDEWQYFNPRKNKSFSHCDTILLLAYRGRKAVGRIMGIINHRYNKSHNENHARFCWMECYNEPDVFAALLNHIEEWARNKKMEKLVGPLGFSDKDPQGFLIEGFDKPIVIATNCNNPYMVDLIEKNNFIKKVDLVVYRIDIPEQLPEVYEKLAERAFSRLNLSVIEFDKKSQLKPMIRPVLDLINETFTEIYGFDKMDEREMDEFAARYLPVVDPRFVKCVFNEKDELVAFVIAMPDMSPGIIRSRGYLFPVGILLILWSARKTKQLDLFLGAIREDYRNLGLDAMMAIKMRETAKKAGFEYVDSHLELEDNFKVRAEMERAGGKVYKKYRIFTKDL